MQIKYGKEQVEEFLAGLKLPNIVDISEVPGGALFGSQTWLFGYDPGMQFIGFYPNNAAVVRVQACGEVNCLFFEVHGLLQYFQKKEPDTKFDVKKWVQQVASMEQDDLKEVLDHVVKYTAKVGDLLFVPSGYIAVEQTGPREQVCYGFRKSYLQSNPEAVAAYKTITGLFESGKRNTDRMKAVIQVLEKSAVS